MRGPGCCEAYAESDRLGISMRCVFIGKDRGGATDEDW